MIRSLDSLRFVALTAALASISFTHQFASAAEGDDADAATIERYTG